MSSELADTSSRGISRPSHHLHPQLNPAIDMGVVVDNSVDLDCDGDLALFDFLAFQASFDAGRPSQVLGHAHEPAGSSVRWTSRSKL